MLLSRVAIPDDGFEAISIERTRMEIPVRMPETRTRSPRQESLIGLNCQS
jgi:hypothetical protein